MLKLGDINCSVMFVATDFSEQPEPAPASTGTGNGAQLASNWWLSGSVCGACTVWGFTEHLEKDYLQFKTLISRKEPVLLGGLGTTVCSCVCVPHPVHQVPHSVPQLPPSPSWQPLSPAPLRHSRCLGMPAVIGGFCCPVSFSDCHLTCAPENTPSGSGLGF